VSEEQDDDDDDGLTPWHSAAMGAIQRILSEADLDSDSGTVTLMSDDWDPTGKGDMGSRTFSSLDELRDALIEIGDSAMIGNMPWEGGPVFSTDSDDLVDAALEEAGIRDFFEAAEPIPDDADYLIGIDDLCEPDRADEIRLTLEEVNDLLIEALAQNPDLMHEVHPRRFEELVAELFKRMGCAVVLTPPSRDGGRDVLAVRRDDVGTMLTLVECKRFRPDRKVGVGLVRSLYGVVMSDRASHGVVATTSSFTRGAKDYQQNLQYHLSLRDFNDLAEWCRRYRKR
jgi:restriction endonuclease